MKFRFEKYFPPIKRENINQEIFNGVKELIISNWGEFDDKFIINHLFTFGSEITLCYYEDKIIAFCAVSKKSILGRKINYMEFTVVSKEFQGKGVGVKVTFEALKSTIVRNFIYLFIGGIEVMFLTPNIRVISGFSSICSFIYPDPYSADKVTFKIQEADEITWNMAQELIKISEKPNRKVEREGLVVHDSYKETPWLIYNTNNAPKHRNMLLNNFAEKYLGYSKAEDKEFIVRARINFISILKLLVA